MKLFPLLLLGLTPAAFLQEPESAPQSTADAADAAQAKVEQATDEAKAKLEAAAKEATDEVEAAAQQAKSELQSAGGELVPEPLDTRTVDPEDFASKLPIDGGPELPPAPVVTVDEVNVREAGLDTGLEEALAFDAEEEWPGMDMPEESSTEDVLVLSHAPVGVPLTTQVGTWALCHAPARSPGQLRRVARGARRPVERRRLRPGLHRGPHEAHRPSFRTGSLVRPQRALGPVRGASFPIP
ncbi:MAG: hypothetical protein R3F17_17160 [Planctomycetota bacterium]